MRHLSNNDLLAIKATIDQYKNFVLKKTAYNNFYTVYQTLIPYTDTYEGKSALEALCASGIMPADSAKQWFCNQYLGGSSVAMGDYVKKMKNSFQPGVPYIAGGNPAFGFNDKPEQIRTATVNQVHGAITRALVSLYSSFAAN